MKVKKIIIAVLMVLAMLTLLVACDNSQPTLTSIHATYSGGELDIGDTLNKADITVTATYSDKSTKKVTDFSVGTLDTSTAGTKTVTITYKEGEITKTYELSITVKEAQQPPVTVTLKSIDAQYKGEALKVGGQLNKADVIVTAKYSDNSTKNVTEFTLSTIDTSVGGDKKVTVTYKEGTVTVTDTITVSVIKQATSLQASCTVTEVDHYSALTKDMLTVHVVYDDKSKDLLKAEDYKVDYDFSKLGETTITITYTPQGGQELSTTVKVTVVKVLMGIEAEYQGGVALNGTIDASKVTVYKVYSDNSKELITEGYELQTDSFSSSAVGTQEVLVKLTGTTFQYTLEVEVYDPEAPVTLKGIKAKFVKTATNFVGDTLTIADFEVVKVMSDMTELDLTQEELATVSVALKDGSTNTTAGEAIYVITFEGKSVEVKVTFVKKLNGITVNPTVIDDVKYNTDIVITVTATYDGAESVEVTDFTTDYDKTKVGQQTVTVTYEENGITKTATLTVTVLEPDNELSSISAEYTGGTVYVGGSLDESKIIVTATYSDQSVQTVSGFEVGTLDTATSGIKTVTISYTEGTITKTFELSIEVVDASIQSIEATLNKTGVVFVNTELVASDFDIVLVMTNGDRVPLNSYDGVIVALKDGSTNTTAGTATYVVTYQQQAVEVQVTFTKQLQSIEVIAPDDYTINSGDELSIIVVAHYLGGDSQVVTSSAVFNKTPTTTGEVEITYTENDVEKSATLNVTVNESATTTYYYYNKDGWDNVSAYAYYTANQVVIPVGGDYVIVGTFWDWTPANGIKMYKDAEKNEYYFKGLQLSVGDEFKIAKIGISGASDTYYNTLDGASNEVCEVSGTNGNFRIKQDGIFDLYFKADSNSLFIGEGTTASVPNVASQVVEATEKWAGTAMQDLGDGWYSITLDSRVTTIIFNDSTLDGNKTNDLTVVEGNVYFDGYEWKDSKTTHQHTYQDGVCTVCGHQGELQVTANKENYYLGYTLVATDITVIVDDKEVTENVELTITQGDINTEGTVTYTVTYMGIVSTVDVQYVKELTGITVDQGTEVENPLTVEYGTDLKSVITVTASYNNIEEVKTVTDYTVEGYTDSDTTSEYQTVTITYTENGKTVSATIYIKVEISEATLDVTSTLTQVDHKSAVDAFKEQLIVKVVSSAHPEGEIISLDDCTVSQFDFNTVGTVTITVSYTYLDNQLTDIVTVEVVKVLTGIRAEYLGGEVDVDGELDATQVKVYKVFSDDTEEEITDAQQYTIGELDSSTEGTKQVTISAFEKSTTIEVVVNDVETLYFYNYANWATVYAHSWKEGETQPATLDGVAMTKEADSKWYYIVVDAESKYIIFHNNSGMQTDDITIEFSTPYYAILGWSDVKSVEDILVLDLSESSWTDANARFAVYMYLSSDGTQYSWLDLQGIAGQGSTDALTYKYYAVDLSTLSIDADMFIVCRMNGSTTENNWDNKWNQTGNLSFSGGLYVKIPTGVWDTDSNVQSHL